MATTRITELLLIFCSVCCVSAEAGVMSLTLQADSDLSTLRVGDSFTIGVVLDKMSIGNLTDLGANVEWTPGYLTGPNNEAAGPTVPDHADLFFTATPGASLDGLFTTLSSVSPEPEILTNGIFFSFDVTAAAPGPGTIGFDFFSLSAYDDASMLYVEDDFDTNTLAFNITVPEPGSITCFVMIGAFGLGRRFRRKTHAESVSA